MSFGMYDYDDEPWGPPELGFREATAHELDMHGFCPTCKLDKEFCSCYCRQCYEDLEDCECLCAVCEEKSPGAGLCNKCAETWNRDVQGLTPWNADEVRQCECGTFFSVWELEPPNPNMSPELAERYRSRVRHERKQCKKCC